MYLHTALSSTKGSSVTKRTRARQAQQRPKANTCHSACRPWWWAGPALRRLQLRVEAAQLELGPVRRDRCLPLGARLAHALELRGAPALVAHLRRTRACSDIGHTGSRCRLMCACKQRHTGHSVIRQSAADAGQCRDAAGVVPTMDNKRLGRCAVFTSSALISARGPLA